MSRHKKRHRIKLKSVYVWHRYIGLTAALFVLVLSVSGLLLNHTERFTLDSTTVQSKLLLDWYGIQAPSDATTFRVNGRHVTLLGDGLYLDTARVAGKYRKLAGAVSLPGWLVIAVDDSILLMTPEGELVERLSGADGIPSGLRTLGISPTGELVVDGSHAFYHPDAQFVSWVHWEGNMRQVEWVTPVPLPGPLLQRLRHDFRGGVLPMERVVLDLHSGRILGTHGIWVMDAAAILLLALSITGFYMWLRRRR